MKKEDKELQVRSVTYVGDESSNQEWFEIWVRLVKKELLNHFANSLEKKD